MLSLSGQFLLEFSPLIDQPFLDQLSNILQLQGLLEQRLVTLDYVVVQDLLL